MTTKSVSPSVGPVIMTTTVVTTQMKLAVPSPLVPLASSAATTPSASLSAGSATVTATAWIFQMRVTPALMTYRQRLALTGSLPAPTATAFMSRGSATETVTAQMDLMKLTAVSI